MPETFKTQAAKNAALRDVLDQLETAQVEAQSDLARTYYRNAAVWLRAVLDKPVAVPTAEWALEAPDTVPDMAVTVAWPGDRGEMQTVVYGRSGGPDPDTMTALDRTIVRALLLHALETLDAMP